MRNVVRTCWHLLQRFAVALVVLTLAAVVAGVLVIRSGWFHERVRESIITGIEKATGGRVELGSFSFDTLHMVAKVGPLVLHGKEPGADPPFLEVPSVSLGLKVISAFERKVDLASLHLEHPHARIVFYPDGSNNVPVPRIPRPTSWAQDLINFSVLRYDVVEGVVEVENRAIPFNIRGENLQIRMAYEAAGPRYRGELSSRRVRALAPGFGPVEIDASTAFTIDTEKIEFSRMHLTTGGSRFDLAGALENVRAPHGIFTVKASVPVKDAVQLFQWPILPTGTATFDGHFSISFQNRFEYGASGRVNARGVGYARDRVKIENAEVAADVNLVSDQLEVRTLKLNALGASLTGAASLAHWKDFHLDGKFDGLSVREAAKLATDRPIAWNGMMAGDLTLDATVGASAAKVQTSTGITPAADGTPLEGQLNVAFDQAANTVRIGNSYVATPATRVDLTGTLGATMQVQAHSTNLEDLLPALAMASPSAPKELPLKLKNGSATFAGTVAGPLNDPRVTGQVTVANGSVEGHVFDRFSGDVEASAQGVKLQRATLARGPTVIEGSAAITPKDGNFDDGAITAQLNLRNVSIEEAAKEVGVTKPISGMMAATVRLSGSVKRPDAEIQFQIEKPVAYGEQADRLRAIVRYSASAIEITSGEVDAGPGKLRVQGAYQHPGNDWHSGDVRFDVASENMLFSRAQTFSKLHLNMDGNLDAKLTGTAKVLKDEVALTAVNGQVFAHALTYKSRPVGELSMELATQGTNLAVRAKGQARGATFQGDGSFRLEGDEEGSAKLRFSRMSVATMHELATIAGTEEQRNNVLPFEGFVEGGATLTGSLRKPRDFHAELTLDAIQMSAKVTQTLRLGVQAQDVVLKNAKPVVIDVSFKEARITSAQFTARDTNLEVTGAVPFDGKAGADLSMRGSVSLGILQLFNPDLLAKGDASVQASVRGALNDPQLSGRMELKNASLYLSDLPNGVDNANGSLFFDRNRATIEKLTAESGGGTVSFSGFVEFGSTLVYRLQAQAQKVRVRYQEIGITLDGRLTLNGTSDSSTVAGVLTLTRATVSARADLGQLLASAAKPVPAPESNDYLRGMQFDVRIESAPNFELQTSLTHDVETEVDLRLRGTPLRPALVGTVSVDQGEIEVFGNRYTIDRGDIRFINPVKIEPSFDMNLETKARGITVNISLSGTMQKLNVNYSSDPPLQSREIIALLAVGRAPSEFSGLNTNADVSGTSSFAEAGGGLLSQAVTAQLTSRLQRFFGASRVKIDPTVTSSVDYLTPQAHLTLEQQVSKDITLTYITNLNRTQEQTVQVEWDISQHWSAIAVRDANGLFGIDVQYRKRFK